MKFALTVSAATQIRCSNSFTGKCKLVHFRELQPVIKGI